MEDNFADLPLFARELLSYKIKMLLVNNPILSDNVVGVFKTEVKDLARTWLRENAIPDHVYYPFVRALENTVITRNILDRWWNSLNPQQVQPRDQSKTAITTTISSQNKKPRTQKPKQPRNQTQQQPQSSSIVAGTTRQYQIPALEAYAPPTLGSLQIPPSIQQQLPAPSTFSIQKSGPPSHLSKKLQQPPESGASYFLQQEPNRLVYLPNTSGGIYIDIASIDANGKSFSFLAPRTQKMHRALISPLDIPIVQKVLPSSLEEEDVMQVDY